MVSLKDIAKQAGVSVCAVSLVVIRDRGIGIPKDDLPHIFEPFYRASNTGSVMGHGVGLALAKAILEKHGAKVNVESQPQHGTTVTVSFLKVAK